jgi:23S rRNA pseudouridine1911/1915/1917 synthase
MDKNIPLNVVYEDKDIVVLNKQAGISVHPSINEPSGTLVDALMARYPELKGVGEDPLRPGIVHRLDKDTSGLLVVAKNQKTFEFLKKQWQEGKVIKKYLALVWGYPKEKGEIVSELTRSLKDFRKRMVVRPEKNNKNKEEINPVRNSPPHRPFGRASAGAISNGVKGKMAITEYKVVKKYRDFSLVEVYPKTGRMHQIRVQMASIGYPVVGDKLYGSRSLFGRSPVGRQFLHAFYLSFSLPNGKKLALETDLPEDLRVFLTKLEK